MKDFPLRNKQRWVEDLALSDIAEQYGTPCYVYSKAAISREFLRWQQPLQQHSSQHLVCYAVKANSNLAVLNVLAQLGAGFDIVSAGELQRVLKAGGDASKVVFSGVAKNQQEIALAINAGIRCFNVESLAEISRINDVAGSLDTIAPVSMRINPDVDANTHAYIATGKKENKFGIAYEDALTSYQRAAQYPNLKIVGIDCHIGSQITELDPFLLAFERILELQQQLNTAGFDIEHLDLGGGLGVCYDQEVPPAIESYIEQVTQRLGDSPTQLLFEPGRSIVANAGVLLTAVEFLKHGESKNFAIVDGGMNDLIRPALYQAYHQIWATNPRQGNQSRYDIVGPVCESGDFFGKDRDFCLCEGDLLAVASAGAYGFVQSCNYNSRPRPAEIMVDHDQSYLVRARESFEDQIRGESLLPSISKPCNTA